MLYLFGRLALNDSLTYHEDFLDDDYLENRTRSQTAAARAAAVGRRLRRGRHVAPAGRPSANRAS